MNSPMANTRYFRVLKDFILFIVMNNLALHGKEDSEIKLQEH